MYYSLATRSVLITGHDDRQARCGLRLLLGLAFGRIVASEIDAPNMFANLDEADEGLCISDNATEPYLGLSFALWLLLLLLLRLRLRLGWCGVLLWARHRLLPGPETAILSC